MTQIWRDLDLHLSAPVANLTAHRARGGLTALERSGRLVQATLALKLQSVRVWMTAEMFSSPGAGGAVWGDREPERGGGVDKSGLAAAHECVVVSCVGLQSSSSFSGSSTPETVDLCVTDFGLEFGEAAASPPTAAGAAGVC